MTTPLRAGLLALLLFPGSSTAVADTGPATYAEELAAIDVTLHGTRERAVRLASSWTAWELVAETALDRARLTGDLADYAFAEDALVTAFAVAPARSGPYLSRAALDFSVHRFERVEESLRAAGRSLLVDGPARAAIVGLRADVALHRGNVAAARQGYDEALRLHETPQAYARLALAAARAGDVDDAEALLQSGGRMMHGPRRHPRAWMHLQRGLVDLSRNRPEEALAHYRDAERELSGWWLVDEHVAEVLARLGRTNEAITLYESVVERNPRPESLAALANLYAERGEADRARACRQRARTAWQPWRERFPEVVEGHSHDHAS